MSQLLSHQHARWSAVLLVVTLFASACSTAVSTTINGLTIVIYQHDVTIAIAPGQSNSATVKCGVSEQLLSGGYGTLSTPLPGRKVFITASMPTDAGGIPPTTDGTTVTAWTVSANNPTSNTINLDVYANCISGAQLAPKVYLLKNFVSTTNIEPKALISTHGAIGQQPHTPRSSDGWLNFQCPSGQLLGGGFQTANNLILDNLPSPNFTMPGHLAWRLGNVTSDTPSTTSLTGYVNCASTNVTSTELATHEIEAANDPGPDCDLACKTHYTQPGSAVCPNNLVLTGGGNDAFTGSGGDRSSQVLQTTTYDEMSDTPNEWYGKFDVDASAEPPQSLSFDMITTGICANIVPDKTLNRVFIDGPIFFIIIPEDKVLVGLDKTTIKAHVHTVNVTQTPSRTLDAVPSSTANGLTFNLTVTALPGVPPTSPAGRVITNVAGTLTCTTTTAVTIDPASGSAAQPCQIAPGIIAASDWSDHSYAGYTYTGSNPAGGSSTSYSVPANCGNPSPAIDAAKVALQAQLSGALPSGEVVATDPTFTIDNASLTCSPAAGTQRATPFTYTQSINGMATQGSVNPREIQDYQLTQLQQLVAAKGAPFSLMAPQVCPNGPTLESKDASQGTFVCAAQGDASYVWSADTLAKLPSQLAGKTPDEALRILNALPAVQSNLTQVSTNGAKSLTTDTGALIIIVRGA